MPLVNAKQPLLLATPARGTAAARMGLMVRVCTFVKRGFTIAVSTTDIAVTMVVVGSYGEL